MSSSSSSSCYAILHAERGGETDEVRTDTEASTGPCGYSQTGDISIQDTKGCGSGECDKSNLIKRQTAFRNSISSDSHHNTLHQILNGSLHEFA